jgi:hypothetical protein
LDASPLGVFSASAGGAFTSGGAGMSPGFGGVGAGGGGGVAGVLAAGGGVSLGGADFWHATPAASKTRRQEGLIIERVMAPRYHGPA